MEGRPRHTPLVHRLLVTALAAAALAAAALAVPGAPAHAATSFTAVADSYVDSLNPDTNSGTKPHLIIDASPHRVAYLRFDLHDVGPSPTAALRFYAESSSRIGLHVRSVRDNDWGERTITYANAPAVGEVVAQTGPLAAGQWVSVNISSLVTGDGPLAVALTTTSDTSVKATSREGANPPQLIVPAPPSPSPFVVTRIDTGTYRAASETNGDTYTGSLKYVVETATRDLHQTGGGTVRFTADTFDLGPEFLKLENVSNVAYIGAGIDQTIIRNYSSAAADTEPFNTTGISGVTIRDLTVSAGGPARTTSDALDFDEGNNVLVERVKVTAARGRGIVFDGKNQDWTSLGNIVRDCVITDVNSHGIHLLASTGNVVSGCTITNAGGHGVQISKSSSIADQPNKTANNNVVVGNVIDRAGSDGINVTSGDNNQILRNHITDSSDKTASRDGIRITGQDSATCDGNRIAGNTATDNRPIKIQRYGLNIASSLCTATQVDRDNTFTGNLRAPINDLGSGTVFQHFAGPAGARR